MLFRLLATLAFVASFDILLFDGKYARAVEQVGLCILQHF
jgi:hypothetical protein